MNKLQVGTLFSGIGSFEWALKRLGIEHDIVFACDNGDVDLEIDNCEAVLQQSKNAKSIFEMKEIETILYSKAKKTNFVEKSYKANFKIADENYHYNVCILDGEKYKNKVEISATKQKQQEICVAPPQQKYTRQHKKTNKKTY